MKKYFVVLLVLVFAISCNKSQTTQSEKKGEKKKVELNKKAKKVKHARFQKKKGFTSFKAPEFALKNTTGDTVKLSDYKGKIILLDFWGTWCPPCRKMIPTLSAFVNKCSKEGVVLIGIHSSGNSPGADAIDDFAGRMGVNYPMLLGTKEVENAYGVKGFPSLFLIGRDGMVKHKFVGIHSLDQIRTYVREEMDKK